jgi:NUC153 domain
MQADPDELSEDAYREFLASGTEDEAEEDDNDPEKIEEYRKKLLGALSGQDAGDQFRKRHLQASDDDGEVAEKKELDIKFNVGFGEDLGSKLIKEKKAKEDLDAETAWESYQRKRKEKRKQKKLEAKQAKKNRQLLTQDIPPEEQKRKEAELALLVSDKHNGVKSEFKANTGDRRFEAVLRNKEYALDPTHRNFRKMAEGEFVKEQKQKRFKAH